MGLTQREAHNQAEELWLKESAAARVFKQSHGFPTSWCWTQYENALDGLGLRAKFRGLDREVNITQRTGNKRPLNEDVWGNLKDDDGKIVVAIQEIITSK